MLRLTFHSGTFYGSNTHKFEPDEAGTTVALRVELESSDQRLTSLWLTEDQVFELMEFLEDTFGS